MPFNILVKDGDVPKYVIIILESFSRFVVYHLIP